MKLLLDVNLPLAWVERLSAAGHDATHWTSVGDPRATDAEIMAHARSTAAVVLTADLDFAALLALAGANGPSVVLLRAQDTWPDVLGDLVCEVLSAHAVAIDAGAIVTVDEASSRLRILPIRSRFSP